MRVVLFTTEEPLYLPRYVRPILDAHADAIERVILAPFDAPISRQLRQYLGMYGVRAGARMAARYLHGHVRDALARRLGHSVDTRHYSVTAIAREHGILVEEIPDVSDPAFVDRMEWLGPDLLLSIVAGQRLPAALLDTATDAINLHGSLLPKYRGRATAFWPLYYGDDCTGVTAHRMTETFDSGPILVQRAFPIEATDTVDSVYRKLAVTGGQLAVDLLDEYPDLPPSSPNETTADDYHGLPGARERRLFRERGNTFL